MSAWAKARLGDCCIENGIQTGPFGSQLHQSDYSEVGTPVIMPKDIRDGRVVEEGIARVGEVHIKRLARHRVAKNNIVYPRRGDVGKAAFITEKEAGWLCGTGCLKVDLNEDVVDPVFVRYFLALNDSVCWLEKHAVGSTMLNINAGILADLPIALPPLPVQRRIAAILSDYDSAIENARRQIALLEEAAMRLYREWFVVHADPKWEKRRLGDVIEFNPKVQIPKGTVHEIVPMSALQVNSMILDSAIIEYGISKSGSKFTNGDTLLARITPCLENGKTAFVGNLKSSCGASGSTEFIVMRSKKLNPYMVYLIARTPNFREAAIKSMSGADGRQRAKEDVLKNIPYRLPSEGLIKKFGDVAGPMFNRAYLLQSQIESLTEARDRLLPKLMSGEIEV